MMGMKATITPRAAAIPAPPIIPAAPPELTVTQKNEIARMPAFKAITSGVMSEPTRATRSLALAADYLVQSGQWRGGRIDSATMRYSGPGGNLPLPAPMVATLNATAATIARMGQQAIPASTPAVISHSDAVKFMPSLVKLPGNVANNTTQVLGLVAQMKGMPGAGTEAGEQARAVEITKLVERLFAANPDPFANNTQAQKAQVFNEIYQYYSQVGGKK